MQSDLIKSVVRTTVPRPVRNWLRSPAKSTQWVWDAVRYYLGSTESLQLAPDWTLRCHPRAYRVAQEAQVADPEQREEFENFVLYCNPGMFLFDIGAHFGIFSLAAAHFGGKAIAVDPSPIAARMIARQCVLNEFTNQIRIIRAAVSDQSGAVSMVSAGVFSDGYFKLDRKREKSELTQTQAITIDQIAHQFGVPSHIKIDVEGHEAAVLRGGRKILREFAPVLFLELHNEMVAAAGGNPNDTLEELVELGYHTFSFTGEPVKKDSILQNRIVRIVATTAD